MENTAARILTRAVDMDKKEQYTMALALYQEGIHILLVSIKDIQDKIKKEHLRERADQYLKRAEKVKTLIDERKAAGKYREQRKIEAGTVGHGYATIFGRFFEDTITHIHIEDAYIRSFHQCQNFVRFCELAVQKCQSLSKISLVTTLDQEDGKKQVARLEEIKQSLSNHLVTLEITYSDTLHDRQISLSTGWVIKIGRGLDYFKPPEGKFALGSCDLELRACHETTVDIFHKSQLQNSVL